MPAHLLQHPPNSAQNSVVGEQRGVELSRQEQRGRVVMVAAVSDRAAAFTLVALANVDDGCNPSL